MKTPKYTKGRIRISKNTDGTDVSQKCIGLDSWIEGDSTNKLNSNRGLHIQIRHNQDEATFEASNRVAHLIAASPDLYHVLKRAYNAAIGDPSDFEVQSLVEDMRAVLMKARGEL